MGWQQLHQTPTTSVTATLAAGQAVGDYRREGTEEYVLVYNGGNSQISPGYGARIVSGSSGYTVTISSTSQTDIMFGIVNAATITTGTYGWIKTKGKATFVADTNSFSIGAGLIAGSNGIFQCVSAVSLGSFVNGQVQICGYALQTAASGAVTGVARFNFM